jgi:hypothetical protein
MAHYSSLNEIDVANVVEVENVDKVADAAKVM